MINPEADLLAIQQYIAGDPIILECVGLDENSTVLELTSVIRRQSTTTDLAGTRILIFHRPSRPSYNNLISNELVQIEIHITQSKQHLASRVIRRLIEIMHRKTVGNKTYYYEGQLGELPTASNYYAAGVRFNTYATI